MKRSALTLSSRMPATTLLVLAMITFNQLAEAQGRVVIAVGTALDGRGHFLHDTRIVVVGSKIRAIDPKASPIDFELRKRSAGRDGDPCTIWPTLKEASCRSACCRTRPLGHGLSSDSLSHSESCPRCPGHSRPRRTKPAPDNVFIMCSSSVVAKRVPGMALINAPRTL
jgi:hypothetical protein